MAVRALPPPTGFANRLHRRRTRLENARIDEGARWMEQGDLIAGFRFTDAAADTRMYRVMKSHQETLDTEDQRRTFTALVREWLADERSEERSLTAQDDHAALSLAEHRANTPMFVSGALAPHGTEPAA